MYIVGILRFSFIFEENVNLGFNASIKRQKNVCCSICPVHSSTTKDRQLPITLVRMVYFPVVFSIEKEDWRLEAVRCNNLACFVYVKIGWIGLL